MDTLEELNNEFAYFITDNNFTYYFNSNMEEIAHILGTGSDAKIYFFNPPRHWSKNLSKHNIYSRGGLLQK
jgi:hypothetical protein